MHARQGTNDGQDHERFQRARQEKDLCGHLPLTESRWRGSLIHGKRLAGVTASVFSSTVVTKVFQTNYKRENEYLLMLIKFAMYTGRKNKLRPCNLCTGQ